MRGRQLLLVAGTFVATAALVGCGDSDDSGSTVIETSTTTTTAAEAAESTTTAAPVETTTTSTEAPVASTTTAPQRGQGAELTESARVSTIGLGPVYVGDTVEVVAEKLGVALEPMPDVPGDETCRYHTAPGGPPGVSFVVTYGRVSRIDIESPSVITTRSGAGIGSTKDEILALFGDKIEATPNASSGGEDLAYVPVDEKDANLRIIFETNAEGVVIRYRTGQLPEVEYPGC
ncbi:MAG: hypothetical protein R2770_06205 [Acidimicrobiales bacterium]|nr:hypothetical protein [Acidimicrobiales bacterium]